jgi:hypothetical protein
MEERKPDQNAGTIKYSEDTPIDESKRTTGSDVGSNAKDTTKADAPEGSATIVGAPNQGTEAR